MQDITAKFKEFVEKGIEIYTKKFLGEKISTQRKNDILKIRRIMYSSYDIDGMMKSIKKYLGSLKTGFWIIQTGNSDLKKFIKNEIKNFKGEFIEKYITLPIEVVQEEKTVRNTRTNYIGVSTDFKDAKASNWIIQKESMKISNLKRSAVLINSINQRENSINSTYKKKSSIKSEGKIEKENKIFTFVR